MKKLILFVAAFVMLGLANVNAQGVAPAAKSTTHITKDGTPDRRFKENKAAGTEATTGKVRADGQPDMRYKENKEASAAKSAANAKAVREARAKSSGRVR